MTRGYDVQVERLPIQALFDLRGQRDDLADWCGHALPDFPGAPNTLAERYGVSMAWLGPDRWLLRGALAEEAGLTEALRPGDAPPEISIVQISDTMGFFRITGPDAADLMTIGCTLDLHPAVFPENGASFTELFSLKALVLRCPGGFDVGVEQSYGAVVAEYFRKALA